MQVQETCAGAAAQVFVAATDGEIDVQRRDVDRKDAERVVNVQQQAPAGLVGCRDDLRKVGQPLSGVEDHLRNHHEVALAADGFQDIARLEAAIAAWLDEGERDAPAPRVFAQDHVQRIELASRRHDARNRVERVEDRAQPLARAGLRHHAIGARRVQQV